MAANSDLLRIREHWLDAYARGDTAVLEQLENPQFRVTHDGTVITRDEQLSDIAQRMRNGSWAARRLALVTRIHHVEEDGDLTTITGAGWMHSAAPPAASFSFVERWIHCDGRWQIVVLQYEHANDTATGDGP